MASYDEVKLEDILHGTFATFNPNTGANKDADSTPSVIVYQEASSTPITTGSVTNMATGRYRWQVSVAAASGFSQGKFYDVWASGTVTGTDTVTQFAPITAFKATNRVVDDLTNFSDTGIRSAIGMTSGNLDSQLLAISVATNAGDLASKTADSGIITTGSGVSGTYASTVSDDNVYWITAPVTPAVSTYGLRQSLSFNLPLNRISTQLQLNGYWNGASTIDIFAYNTRTSVYDKLTNTGTNLASRATELVYSVPIPRDYVDSAGGVYNIVLIELRGTSTTNANRLRLDRALMYHIAEEAPFTMSVPTVNDIWSAPTRTLTSLGSEPTTPPTVAEIASGVWQAAVATHSGVSGSTAAYLSLINSLPTVVQFEARTLPSGSYFDPATDTVVNVTNVASLSGLDIPTLATMYTNVVAIKTTTDKMVFTVANQLNVNAFTVTQSGIRSAVGLASANLDTQLSGIPTVTQLNARTLPSGDYFNPVSDVVAHVTLVDTTTTNTDMISATGIEAIKVKTDQLTFTSADKLDVKVYGVAETGFRDIFETYTLTESYPASGAIGTPAQAYYMIQQGFLDFAISGVTISVKKLDGTQAATFTMDSSGTPTLRRRTL
jgi:hypothetical protein